MLLAHANNIYGVFIYEHPSPQRVFTFPHVAVAHTHTTRTGNTSHASATSGGRPSKTSCSPLFSVSTALLPLLLLVVVYGVTRGTTQARCVCVVFVRVFMSGSGASNARIFWLNMCVHVCSSSSSNNITRERTVRAALALATNNQKRTSGAEKSFQHISCAEQQYRHHCHHPHHHQCLHNVRIQSERNMLNVYECRVYSSSIISDTRRRANNILKSHLAAPHEPEREKIQITAYAPGERSTAKQPKLTEETGSWKSACLHAQLLRVAGINIFAIVLCMRSVLCVCRMRKQGRMCRVQCATHSPPPRPSVHIRFVCRLT